jgi:hypothetical protein
LASTDSGSRGGRRDGRELRSDDLVTRVDGAGLLVTGSGVGFTGALAGEFISERKTEGDDESAVISSDA